MIFNAHYVPSHEVIHCHCWCVADIHNVRPHKGQKAVAKRLNSLLHSDVYRSEISGKVTNMLAHIAGVMDSELFLKKDVSNLLKWHLCLKTARCILSVIWAGMDHIPNEDVDPT